MGHWGRSGNTLGLVALTSSAERLRSELGKRHARARLQLIRTHTHTCACTLTHTHAHALSHTHAHTHMHMLSHTHALSISLAFTCTHTHTLSLSHTHTPWLLSCSASLCFAICWAAQASPCLNRALISFQKLFSWSDHS